jgi:hypothetical protein
MNVFAYVKLWCAASMLLSVVLLMVLVGVQVMAPRIMSSSYSLYDAQQSAPARPWLQKRKQQDHVMVPRSFGGADIESPATLDVAQPGQPGRYLLPADAAGATDLHLASYIIEFLVSCNQTYVALQGLLLIAMLTLYFAEISKLPRISIIVTTLTESVEPVAEFLVMLVPLVVSLAIVGCMTVGGKLRPAVRWSIDAGMNSSTQAKH